MSDKIGQNTRGRAGLGRPKGVPNKITGSMKEMILEAFEKAGGAEWLAKQADENPVAFMGLLGKLLPSDIALSAQAGTGASLALQVNFVTPPLLDKPD
jgi:hypothetical protein